VANVLHRSVGGRIDLRFKSGRVFAGPQMAKIQLRQGVSLGAERKKTLFFSKIKFVRSIDTTHLPRGLRCQNTLL